MPVEHEARTVREAVGVFNRPEELQHAIDELLSSGFHRAELSLLAGEQAVEEELGHRYKKISALADHPTVPRAVYVSTEAIGDAEGGLIGGLMYVGGVAAAGLSSPPADTLAVTIAAAALAGGAGGLIGSILGQMDRRSPCALPARAAGSRWSAVVGADLGCGGRNARRRNSQKAFGKRCPRSYIASREAHGIAAPREARDETGVRAPA